MYVTAVAVKLVVAKTVSKLLYGIAPLKLIQSVSLCEISFWTIIAGHRTPDYASGTTTQKSSNIGPSRMPQFY